MGRPSKGDRVRLTVRLPADLVRGVDTLPLEGDRNQKIETIVKEAVNGQRTEAKARADP